MKINMERLLQRLQELVETPSVVGYYPQIHALLEEFGKEIGVNITYDHRHTAYITLEGQNSDKIICYGGHLDTIGYMVRSVDENGLLKVRNLGGLSYTSTEGENVIIHTRSGKDYAGMIIHESHSVHVFDDAREAPRDVDHMRILIDADVHSPEDVAALGILPGDPVSVEPRYMVTEGGYIKSRHIDDKAAVAVLLEAIQALVESGTRPACTSVFAFPIYEEIGLGGAYVPEGVDAYIALDIGLIGPDNHGDEKKVSICAADRHLPYDWELTSRLIQTAREMGLPFGVDTFYRYGSDASAAVVAGNNIIPALYGPAVWSSHGYERTHVEGIKACAELTLALLESDF